MDKKKIKPVLNLVFALVFFPLAYFYSSKEFIHGKVISLFMASAFCLIGVVLWLRGMPSVQIVYFFNMISFAYFFAYLGPLINQKKFAYRNFFIYLARVLVLIIFLIPMSFIPIYFFAGNTDHGFKINDNLVIHLSSSDSVIIFTLSLIWYLLSIYSLLKPSSTFQGNI